MALLGYYTGSGKKQHIDSLRKQAAFQASRAHTLRKELLQPAENGGADLLDVSRPEF